MEEKETSTEALLITQERLLAGLDVVAESLASGTFNTSPKQGSAPPSQSGWLTLILLLSVEDELEARIRGFQRTIDPNLLIKTL